MYSILVEVIVFVGTVVMAMTDSSTWPAYFFWITMTSVVVLNGERKKINNQTVVFQYTFITLLYLNFYKNCLSQIVAGGIYQNSVYGMAAKLPFKYTGAVVLGSNVSGTFTAIISIASTYMSSSVRTAAIYYFIGAMFVLLLCFDTYFALPLNVSD